MKQTILNNWHFMRVLRLLLGITIIVQGIYTQQWMFIAVGIFFTLLPLFNIGCCGVNGSCSTPAKKSSDQKQEDISFEEVK